MDFTFTGFALPGNVALAEQLIRNDRLAQSVAPVSDNSSMCTDDDDLTQTDAR